MVDIKFYGLSWDKTLLRYYLVMLTVIVGVMTQTWIIASLALPIFFSAIMGIKISTKKKNTADAKMVNLKTTKRTQQKVS